MNTPVQSPVQASGSLCGDAAGMGQLCCYVLPMVPPALELAWMFCYGTRYKILELKALAEGHWVN